MAYEKILNQRKLITNSNELCVFGSFILHTSWKAVTYTYNTYLFARVPQAVAIAYKFFYLFICFSSISDADHNNYFPHFTKSYCIWVPAEC